MYDPWLRQPTQHMRIHQIWKRSIIELNAIDMCGAGQGVLNCAKRSHTNGSDGNTRSNPLTLPKSHRRHRHPSSVCHLLKHDDSIFHTTGLLTSRRWVIYG